MRAVDIRALVEKVSNIWDWDMAGLAPMDWPAPTGYYYEPGQWEMNGAVRQSLGDLTCSTTGGKRYGANRTVKIA